MARKKLLTEGEIRQFMKLANLRPVGQQRLSEMYGTKPGLRDDEMGDEMGDEMAPEMPVDDMAPEGEEEVEDVELGPEPEEGGGGMVSMDDFMSALERAIEEVTGEEADVSEDPGDEELPGDEGDEGGMEMDMAMDMDAEEEEPMMEEREAEARRKKREKMKQQEEEEEKAKGKGKKGFAEGWEKPKSASGSGPSKKGGKIDRGDVANVVPSSGQLKEEEEELEERAPRMQRRASDFPSTEPGRKFGKPKKEKPIVGPEGEGAGEDEDPLRYKGSKGKRPGTGVGIAGVTSEEIVHEVAKRVAERLQAQNSKEKMIDQLAERIMKRLTKM